MTLRVLLVDDNEEFLCAAERLLAAEGLSVVATARTAAQAVALTRSLQPDVACVDIKLGPDSGIELIRRLVEDSATGAVRVVLISTHAEEDFRDLIEASPATAFIAKSGFSAEAVLNALGEHS